MDEHQMVRNMMLRMGRGAPATAALAKALAEWAGLHLAWLTGREEEGEAAPEWPGLLEAVAAAPAPAERRPHVMALGDALADLLALELFDAALLALMVAADRLPRVSALAGIAARHGIDLPTFFAELAGADPHEGDRLIRRSPVVRFGLADFVANRKGETEVAIRWTLERVLDRAPAAGPELLDLLVGRRQPATLGAEDFAHVEDMDFLVRLLAGAARERAVGINILIHGPPGTGKTEFARTLVGAAGLALYGIGEADEDGEEPERYERVNALTLAQRLLAGRGGTALLFDEMEDLIGDATPSTGGWVSRRQGSKVFVNRLLETNSVPVVWTTNAIGNIDGAILRRMSFVLKLDLPSRGVALGMLARITDAEGVEADERVSALVDAAPEASTVFRVAARAGRLAGEVDGMARPASALVRALRGGMLPPDGPGALDLDLYEIDRPLSALFEAIRNGGAADVSLLLTGPPGTGKTALAHHLARTLDRPLIVKRASDLLSKWVGETEAQIAEAFAEARARGGVLLFDEADSLLFDRTTARNSWEVGQVNELLTWLDRHPLPVVAATNHALRLDPATLRRFVWKLHLGPLGPGKAAAAFRRFFGVEAPASLSVLANLTPGDFAVVARQLRHDPARDAGGIIERLRAEAAAKPEAAGRIGSDMHSRPRASVHATGSPPGTPVFARHRIAW